jgi:hypothetical protein
MGGRGGGRNSTGRGQGHDRNICLGSYTNKKWQKLSAKDKKKVHDGRKRSAEQRTQQGNNSLPGAMRNLSQVGTDMDNQSAITIPTTIITPSANTSSDTPNAQSASGDNKRSNTDSSGSFLSQRRLNKIVAGRRLTNIRNDRSVHQIRTTNVPIVHGACKLDLHAVTCIAGPNCIVLEYTNQVTNISAS